MPIHARDKPHSVTWCSVVLFSLAVLFPFKHACFAFSRLDELVVAMLETSACGFRHMLASNDDFLITPRGAILCDSIISAIFEADINVLFMSVRINGSLQFSV